MKFLAAPLLLLAAMFTAVTAFAGGSGLNVIVVVNQNSTNSLQLGNDYCEKRGVPPQNLFRMTGWTGGVTNWSQADFDTLLLNPLLAMIVNRGLTNQAAFVLLSMDIPFNIGDDGSYNSTTAALFYGFKTNTGSLGTCSLPDSSSNSYAFSELPFREAPPNTAPTNSFLAMMLTDNSFAGAELILTRGVASDSTFPTQTVFLAKTSDPLRNVRFVEFDNAIFEGRVRGDNSLVWTNIDFTYFTNSLGLMTGLANLSLPANAFVPGAMGDSLTSYAGIIFGDSGGQTTLLAFLEAGAAGSYGTITEPCNYTQKFPNPIDYFYQNRGFCLAEAYYQSLQNPFQGLLAGEPLSAPFARPGSADWGSLTNGTVLSGQVALSPTFFAAATNLPLGRVDLFVDGSFFQTITDLPPSAGNVLSVTLNGFTTNCTVSANATLASVASDLAAALNAQINSTWVQAWPVGDRLELQSLDVTVPGSNVTLNASTAIGSAAQLTSLLTPAQPAFLDTIATGYHSVLAGNTPVVGDWLQLEFIKTNGTQIIVAVTNTAPSTTIATLVQNLVNLVNANPALQSADGVLASDFFDITPYGIVAAQLTLYAGSPGWPASQIQVAFAASTNLLALPAGTNMLEDNLSDLQPRNHLYVSSGATSLPVSFTLDTTQLPDGFHQLTAVAHEGTSVDTQTAVSRNVQIQNSSLSANFTLLLAGTNSTMNMPLQFNVAANTSSISSIELLSTGGSLGLVSNQQSVVFTVAPASLGLGLHPFYVLVTDTSGHRYQTQILSVRLVPSFAVSITGSPLLLSWPSIFGLSYDILTTTNLQTSFQVVTSFVVSNSVAQWLVPAPTGAASFYRIGLTP